MARKQSRSPQVKKELSYERDHRNTYRENSKSSRKNISRRKTIVNQTNRHADKQALSDIDPQTGTPQSAVGRDRAKKTWRKSPDVPLKEVVLKKLKRRVDTGQSTPESASNAARKVRSRKT